MADDGKVVIKIDDSDVREGIKVLDNYQKTFNNFDTSDFTVEIDGVNKSVNQLVRDLNKGSSFKGFKNSLNDANEILSRFKDLGADDVIQLKELKNAVNSAQNSFNNFNQPISETKQQFHESSKASDEATNSFKKQENGMQSLINAGKNLVAGYIGLRGAIKAFNFTMESVDAFRVQERAIASLNTTLQNAGVYSAEYSAKIQELASSIQSYSNYGDEAIIKAQALGQSFAGQVPFTENATKAVVDFAAATGMDLEQAFTLFGKSIGSSTNALGRYGVELQKGMTDSQKMEAITKQLGDRYKGQAAQMADAGTQLKNSIGDMKEAFGSILNGYVTNWQGSMNKMVQATTNFINSIRIMHSEVSNLSTSDLEKRYNENAQKIAAYEASASRSMSYEALKREAALKAENNLILEQIKYIRQRQNISSNVKPIKFTDETFADNSISAPVSRSTVGSSNVQQIKDDYEKLQAAVQNARREIELAAIAHGTSSTEVQNAFVKYNQLNTELSNINSLFDTQTEKVEQQKGAYQLLNDNVTSLTAKLRDLAAENQVGSAEWNNYKTQLQGAKTELDNINKSLEDNGVKIDGVAKSISSSISSGLVNALRNGGNAFDAFSSLASSALQKILDKMLEMAVITPILDAFTGGVGGSLLSFLGFKDGGAFQNGNVIPFAKGGVVNKPTIFPMANGGTGLMGEAGAEAVMPLRRMSNGRLGVEASSENGKAVQVNIYNQSNSQVETRQRNDGGMDIIIKRVNEALMNERTSSGFRAAYQREDRKGLQAV